MARKQAAVVVEGIKKYESLEELMLSSAVELFFFGGRRSQIKE